MDFIEQVGTRYLEGKAYAAPQQIENFAKKQFKGSHHDDEAKSKSKSRRGSVSDASEEEDEDEEEEEEEEEDIEKRSKRSSTKGAGKSRSRKPDVSEKDLEIARLRGELEEARRRGDGETTHSSKKEQKAQQESHSPTHKARRASSTNTFDSKGIKVVRGALVVDAASRRHREKRPEHGATKGLSRTVDGKGLGVASGALVAERRDGARSKSRHAAQEPVIVEAAPRPRPRRRHRVEEEDDEEDDEEEKEHGSAHGTVAHSTLSRKTRGMSFDEDQEARKSERGSIAPSRASARRRSSFGEKSEGGGSLAPSHPSTRRRSFAERSEVGSRQS